MTRLRALLFVVLVVAWQAGPLSHAAAPAWQEPVDLTNDAANSRYPSIAIDPSGIAHVVWCEPTISDNCDTIYHSRDDGHSWSQSVDVVYQPGGLADAPVLRADSSGMLHLVWVGGGSDQVFYSRAHASQAVTAHGWQSAVAISDLVASVTSPDLAIDSLDGLHLVYTVRLGEQSGVYYCRSTDGGDTWSAPQGAFANRDAGKMVDRARVAVDETGGIHVVWSEFSYPETFPPVGIRYVGSADGGQTWGVPVSLADGPYDYAAVAVRDGQEAHAVWSGTNPDRFKFHAWSSDGGLTWSVPVRRTELGGFQGWPALVVDGDKTLHWLQVGTLFDPPDDGLSPDRLYYLRWDGNRWTDGMVLLGNSAENNLTNVAAAVALGNQLHLVVQYPQTVQGGGWQDDVVYLRGTVDAKSRAAVDLPTLAPITGTPQAEMAAPAVTADASGPPMPLQTAALPLPETSSPVTGLDGIAAGLLPVAFLLAVVLAVRLRRSRSG